MKEPMGAATNAIAREVREKVTAEKPAEDKAKSLVAMAETWAGRNFKEGQTARCADFVREVLDSVNIRTGVTRQPMDGEPPNPETANSFFGSDLGVISKRKEDLKPGDLVAFGGTYGGWPPSVITHVGIYVGGGQIIDRPTSNAPVKRRSVDTFKHFVAGVTLAPLVKPQSSN